MEIKNDQISDFILEGKNRYTLSGKKIPKINHGSGCNYSSSLLFSLASGNSLKKAVKFSKQFTYNSIKNAKSVGYGIGITQIKGKDVIHTELTHAINKFIEIKNTSIFSHLKESIIICKKKLVSNIFLLLFNKQDETQDANY